MTVGTVHGMCQPVSEFYAHQPQPGYWGVIIETIDRLASLCTLCLITMQSLPKLYQQYSTVINTVKIRGDLDVHYSSSTARQRPNHHSTGRACGLAHRDNRPRCCRTPAGTGPSLARPACPLRL